MVGRVTVCTVAGNGSGNYILNWYQDISETVLPRARVFSVPIFIYRLFILVWALWLAFAIVKWLRWAWECFSSGGLWQPVKPVRLRKTPPEKKAPAEEIDMDLNLPDDEIPEI